MDGFDRGAGGRDDRPPRGIAAAAAGRDAGVWRATGVLFRSMPIPGRTNWCDRGTQAPWFVHCAINTSVSSISSARYDMERRGLSEIVRASDLRIRAQL